MPFARPIREDFPYFPEGVMRDKSFKLDELIPGCREPDCIPSIDNPKWLDRSQAKNQYSHNEEVFGMFIIENGEIRETYAFPMTILDFHEIVNFKTTYRKSVAMTYCPLCQTVTAYDRIINGKELELGVSGLLFNSALVIYDRQTNALFSQVWSKGIVGEYTGIHLQQLPLVQTTLNFWIESFPDTRILSKDTGFPNRQKRYGTYPYRDYKTSDQLSFPVKVKDNSLHPKALVYTIELGDQVFIIQQSKLKENVQHTPKFYSRSLFGGRLFFQGELSEYESASNINWENWIPSGISFYFAARAYFKYAEIL